MRVQVMDVMHYPEDGSHWKSIRVLNPSWNEIEIAVRRLDKNIYPFIWFSLDKTGEECELPADFEVMGGKGDYFVAGSVEGYFQRSFFNPEGMLEEVRVWESDQGLSISEDRVCHDIETVLQAVKYFCEHGTFDPALTWEDQERDQNASNE